MTALLYENDAQDGTCWTPVAVLRQVKRVLRITGLRVNDFYMGLRISAFLVLVGILSSEM